ncbi:hypothetical protein T4A_10896 [Trichinella pseudospiralis]|uniref:Uncharacterized protein n=1 Tax=Trichinella pseudospiralis TaxID=6337 RepID=A0A0V1E2X7_TRIPS|nr:hypothetical protein T4A_10896 [Trichinella pseudospiralis]
MNFKALSAHEEETYSSLLCYPSSDKNAASLREHQNSNGEFTRQTDFSVVTFVTSSMNQTNETDAGVAKYFDKIKGHKRTVNAKWMNMNEIVDGQQIKKEIKDLRRATNGTFWIGLRKESGHSEQLFHNATTKAAGIPVAEEKAAIIILLIGCVLCSIILIFRYDIPKKITTYVRQHKKPSATDVLEKKLGIFLGKRTSEEWMKLQLQ